MGRETLKIPKISPKPPDVAPNTIGVSLERAVESLRRATIALSWPTRYETISPPTGPLRSYEDPELFKALLQTPKSVSVQPEARSRLAPYLIGGMSLMQLEGE